jgi:tetratricopeptide (TPR) repeat protein
VYAERCDPWAAQVVSIQGTVEAQHGEHRQWQPVRLNDALCAGDRLRVRDYSRAAIRLPNETVIRLDQDTAVTFQAPEKRPSSLLDLLIGTVYSISRVPRGLRIRTPYVNAAIKGTEFWVRVGRDQAWISVFEGAVTATNEAGSLVANSGQTVIAARGQAPEPHIVVRPRDTVQWALYYPPVVDPRPEAFPALGPSVEAYRKGNLAGAFARLEEVPEHLREVRFYTYRASLRLYVGRVEEAQADIAEALRLDPRHGAALALRAIIALVQNDPDQAQRLAEEAVVRDPRAATPHIALSYTEQAGFELTRALQAVQEAVRLEPQNALAWARLAELWLAMGDLDRALEAATEAAQLHPELSRTQTVLGYAYLIQFRARQAQETFERAIALDQADPLPRLGLGLAKIRQGKLAKGRQEIEIAAILDPTNSIVRSYSGKAYYEEKREALAESQLALAKELDPRDPTPWFYDAIRKQTENRPVEALHDLQRSITLNDYRAVYRSRLLLEEDLAARSASLSRIYRDLGFEPLALVQGWKSVSVDPSNYSAHRLLADAYSALPRHEIARVSELLQSQLLQPINLTPLQPQLAVTHLAILEGAGPSEPGLNEFNPLFVRNRTTLQVSGLFGSHGTWGDDLILSGLRDRLSYSIGQFHYETEGLRPNNDFRHDIHNAFVQWSLSPKASAQVELRYRETESGDIELRFDPNNFFPADRREIETDLARVGYHQTLTPRSDLIASLAYERLNDNNHIERTRGTRRSTADFSLEADGYTAELQHLYHAERTHVATGVGFYRQDGIQDVVRRLEQGGDIVSETGASEGTDIEHANTYVYWNLRPIAYATWTVGLSYDDFYSTTTQRTQFNPKLGLIWNTSPSTTIRLAAFRALRRALISNQTIEPTHVAGFNQYFDDFNATDTTRYGAAVDQRFSPDLFGGLELSWRDLKVPTPPFPDDHQKERFHRAYLHWTPLSRLALSAEYQFDTFESELLSAPHALKTRTLPLGLSWFPSERLFGRLIATHVRQDVEFRRLAADQSLFFVDEADHFWLFDAELGYRLPRRAGVISIVVRNLFDQQFEFQDRNFQTNEPQAPEFQPERQVFIRFTLNF